MLHQKRLRRHTEKKAIENHPDQNKGDPKAEERFKDINEAYSTLSNPKTRQTYDRFGADAVRGQAGQGGHGQADFSSFSDFFEDAFSGESIFDTFFRQGKNTRRQSQKGSDLRYNLEISLIDAFNGKTVKIKVLKKDKCSTCDGAGSKTGRSKTCPSCNGSGQMRQNRGLFSVSTTCSACRGEGVVISDPCARCSGTGLRDVEKEIKVNIPKGISDGQSIHIGGEGEAGPRGGLSGDLYIVISVRNDTGFERKGEHLYCEMSIHLLQAVLGDEMKMENIDDEKIVFKIAPGTQPNSTLRLRNKGMPLLNGRERGDLYVTLNVEIPKRLSSEEKNLYKQLLEKSSVVKTISPKKRKKSFFGI